VSGIDEHAFGHYCDNSGARSLRRAKIVPGGADPVCMEGRGAWIVLSIKTLEGGPPPHDRISVISQDRRPVSYIASLTRRWAALRAATCCRSFPQKLTALHLARRPAADCVSFAHSITEESIPLQRLPRALRGGRREGFTMRSGVVGYSVVLRGSPMSDDNASWAPSGRAYRNAVESDAMLTHKGASRALPKHKARRRSDHSMTAVLIEMGQADPFLLSAAVVAALLRQRGASE